MKKPSVRHIAIALALAAAGSALVGCSPSSTHSTAAHFNQVPVSESCFGDMKQAAADFKQADASPNPNDGGSTLGPGDLAYDQALRDCRSVDEFESALSQNLGASIWTSSDQLNPAIDIGGSCYRMMPHEAAAVCLDAIKIGLDKLPGW